MKAGPRMLEGLRITDLSTVIFGPYCTQVLSDLGAEVIKVEPPELDTSRNIGTPANTPKMGPVHMRLNRGKQHVNWNIKTPEGRAQLEQLIASSDIFLHNVRSEAIARAGLSHEDVRAIKPDIIYVHCTGFDQRGPYAGLQAYDDIIQAASGMASLLPRVDGDPRPRFLPSALADKVSGLHAVYAVLAAVIHRMRTGEGQFIEVPMFESVVSFMLLEHLCDKTFVPPTGPSGYQRQLDPARQPIRTADGYIAIAPYIDERWLRFFQAAGEMQRLDDPRYATPELRRANMSDLYRMAEQFMPSRTTAEWLAICQRANVPAIRVNELDDLLHLDQLKAVGLIKQREHPTEGRYLEVGQPVRFSAYETPSPSHAAHPGEHSDAVAQTLRNRLQSL